jgi:Flp pilus assembly protein TadG
MSDRSRERRREGGASAVEFALVLPILALFLLGIIQFGWYFFVANNASSAAREAARRVVVGDCWADFETFVKGQAPTTTSATYAPADLGDASVQVGDPVTVTVVADGAIIGFIPWGASGGQVTREFTARLEDKTAGSCT